MTPDAELTSRGYLDTRVLVMDGNGTPIVPIALSNEVQRLSYGGSPTAGHDVHA